MYPDKQPGNMDEKPRRLLLPDNMLGIYGVEIGHILAVFQAAE